jgi:hypothetical protein
MTASMENSLDSIVIIQEFRRDGRGSRTPDRCSLTKTVTENQRNTSKSLSGDFRPDCIVF